MRHFFSIAAATVILAAPMGAQTTARPTSGPEFRTFVGAFVPTGDQRSDFKDATLLGAQIAQEFSPWAHVLGSFSWTNSSNKFATLNDHGTNIWQYDVGAEINSLHNITNEWFLRPFIGAGIGARTYDYKAASAPTKTCTSGYGSAGMEFQRFDGAIRLDVRDYLNCFENPITAKKSTRNDLGFSLGLVYHLR